MIGLWSQIPSLRLDKYLYLIRQYIAHSFIYLSRHQWLSKLVGQYLSVIEELPLSPDNGKVPDGVRYHVLDVWVDGFVDLEGWKGESIMAPVEALAKEGLTKVVRQRARETLIDERFFGEIGNGNADDNDGADELDSKDEGFKGFDD